MRYIPNSRGERGRMLESVGLPPVDELFDAIPGEFRLTALLDLPPALDEPALARLMGHISAENEGAERRTCILGGGAYHHYIPSVVGHVLGRSEFYTAYTPYQPEISQGTLQAIFEYQTMMASLTGLDISNASLYDGASATAEAVLMSLRVTGKRRVVLSRGLNPSYRDVVRTYLENGHAEIVEAPLAADGRTDTAALAVLLDDDTACFVVQNPNFLGLIEDGPALAGIRQAGKALLVGVFTEALSLGLLSPPGAWGADIAAGEGQSFGLPLGFGGPYLGILAVREAYVRQMPGRLVGETVDAHGERGYVLTLATREQHIRRDRATSNICTNEGLCALAAAVYLATLGPAGLRAAAAHNVMRARAAIDGLGRLPGWSLPLAGAVFNEFVAVPADGAAAAQRRLLQAGFTGGLPIGRWYPELPEALLFCFTEMTGDDDLARFLAAAGGQP